MTNAAIQQIDAALARIRQVDPALRIMIATLDEPARRRAADLDASFARGAPPGSLFGEPVAVKDNICTDIGTTTCASRMLANFRAPYNAHVIERLQAAGAVIIGKTNLDEFAMG